MTNSPSEVPYEFRDLVDRSVEKARKAFDGLLGVAQHVSVAVLSGGLTAIGAHLSACAKQNINSAFDLADKLLEAQDPQEAFALRSESLKSQLAALLNQAGEFGRAVQKCAPTSASN